MLNANAFDPNEASCYWSLIVSTLYIVVIFIIFMVYVILDTSFPVDDLFVLYLVECHSIGILEVLFIMKHIMPYLLSS